MGINYYAYIASDEWRQRADAAKQRGRLPLSSV